MKLKFLLLLATAASLVCNVVLAADYNGNPITAGEHFASVNLNIRSTPMVGPNLIGYFRQGESVAVTSTTGNWCRVAYGGYRQAYVYCPYLIKKSGDEGDGLLTFEQPATPGNFNTLASTPENPAAGPYYTSASELLTSLNNWLQIKEVGKNYINDSYWQGYTRALAWSDKAKPADFNFEYPAASGRYCTMVFSSTSMRSHVFKSWCFAPGSDQVETFELFSRSVPTGFDLPSTVFSKFVVGLLNDDDIMKNLHDNLEDGSVIKAYFRLYDVNGKGPFWEAKFVNTVTGSDVTIRVDANKSKPVFTIVSSK